MIIHAGQLRDRIDIEEPVASVGDGGQPQETWRLYKHTWADVQTESVKEALQGDKPESQTQWKIAVRFDAGITQKMRVNHDGRIINIDGTPRYDKTKRFMFIVGKEEQ